VVQRWKLGKLKGGVGKFRKSDHLQRGLGHGFGERRRGHRRRQLAMERTFSVVDLMIWTERDPILWARRDPLTCERDPMLWAERSVEVSPTSRSTLMLAGSSAMTTGSAMASYTAEFQAFMSTLLQDVENTTDSGNTPYPQHPSPPPPLYLTPASGANSSTFGLAPRSARAIPTSRSFIIF
jgi:hypothetical protein